MSVHNCILYPLLSDAQDEQMQEMMIELRGRFKTICAKLGLSDKVLFVGTSEQITVNPSLEF